MRPETIPNKYAWFIVGTLFSLWIEYKLKPLQANVRVGETSIGERIDPTRRRIRSLVSLMGLSRPDYYGV
jgi:hypothetical protein